MQFTLHFTDSGTAGFLKATQLNHKYTNRYEMPHSSTRRQGTDEQIMGENRECQAALKMILWVWTTCSINQRTRSSAEEQQQPWGHTQSQARGVGILAERHQQRSYTGPHLQHYGMNFVAGWPWVHIPALPLSHVAQNKVHSLGCISVFSSLQ